MSDQPQRFSLRRNGHDHLVEITSHFARSVTWLIDGETVATKSSHEDHLRLEAPEGQDHLGVIGVWFPALFGAVRRVTLFEGTDEVSAVEQSVVSVGGIDLEPEPGSPAALREAKIRAHPTRFAIIATLLAVAKVALPLLVGLLGFRLVMQIDWPEWNLLPDWTLPDWNLPDWDLPWPTIPWPDWSFPAVSLPVWMREVLDKAKYVWPVVLAYVLARGEIRRRRHQDQLRRDELETGAAWD